MVNSSVWDDGGSPTYASSACASGSVVLVIYDAQALEDAGVS